MDSERAAASAPLAAPSADPGAAAAAAPATAPSDAAPALAPVAVSAQAPAGDPGAAPAVAFPGLSPAAAIAAGAVAVCFSSHRARDRAGVDGEVGRRRGCRACYSWERRTGRGIYVVPVELAAALLAPTPSGWRTGKRRSGVVRLRGPYADLGWCWSGGS